MTDSTLQLRIERLEAIEEIRRLKALYCLHCDRDYAPDALAALFTEDAVWDAGPLRGVHAGREAIRRFFAGVPATIPYAAHLVTNPLIEVDLDSASATGQWRMMMPCAMEGEDGLFAALQVAEYDEVYQRVAGTWFIASLKVRLQRLSLPGTAWLDFSGNAV